MFIIIIVLHLSLAIFPIAAFHATDEKLSWMSLFLITGNGVMQGASIGFKLIDRKFKWLVKEIEDEHGIKLYL
jgi:hypothetical protein